MINSQKRKNLITLRKEKEMTQEQVAERLKITVRHYKALEAGTSNGSVEIWQHLKSLLGAKSIDYLLEQTLMANTKEPDGNQAE